MTDPHCKYDCFILDLVAHGTNANAQFRVNLKTTLEKKIETYGLENEQMEWYQVQQ